MNEKLLRLGQHFDSVFVHLGSYGWTASAEKKVQPGVEVNVKSGTGHHTPEAAVDALFANVQKMSAARSALPATL